MTQGAVVLSVGREDGTHSCTATTQVTAASHTPSLDLTNPGAAERLGSHSLTHSQLN
jgi:hypothetical protein